MTTNRELQRRAWAVYRTAVSGRYRDGMHLDRQPCEVCGDPKTDGHHEDYSRPLEVRWLCRLCHARAHRSEGVVVEPGAPWHGTLSGYTGPARCRCEDCRRAKREYARAYRKAHPERDRATGRLREAAA